MNLNFLNNYWPVIIVLIAFLISWVATNSSGMSDRKKSTVYNSVVGKSRFEPPGWVFGVVWFIIFTGYALIWVLANQRIKDSILKNSINLLLGIGIMLNILWSVFIILGSNSIIPVLTAHYFSTGILLILGIYNIYLLYNVNTAFKNTNSSSLLRYYINTVLVIYIIWPFIAFLLSVTAPIN